MHACVFCNAEDVIGGKQGWTVEQNTTDKVGGLVSLFNLSCSSDILSPTLHNAISLTIKYNSVKIKSWKRKLLI